MKNNKKQLLNNEKKYGRLMYDGVSIDKIDIKKNKITNKKLNRAINDKKGQINTISDILSFVDDDIETRKNYKKYLNAEQKNKPNFIHNLFMKKKNIKTTYNIANLGAEMLRDVVTKEHINKLLNYDEDKKKKKKINKNIQMEVIDWSRQVNNYLKTGIKPLEYKEIRNIIRKTQEKTNNKKQINDKKNAFFTITLQQNILKTKNEENNKNVIKTENKQIKQDNKQNFFKQKHKNEMITKKTQKDKKKNEQKQNDIIKKTADDLINVYQTIADNLTKVVQTIKNDEDKKHNNKQKNNEKTTEQILAKYYKKVGGKFFIKDEYKKHKKKHHKYNKKNWDKMLTLDNKNEINLLKESLS